MAHSLTANTDAASSTESLFWRLALIMMLSAPVIAWSHESLTVPAFSRCIALTDCGWEALSFPKRPVHTDYQLRPDAGITRLQVKSVGGASALIWSHAFPVTASTRLRWQWRVARLPVGPLETTAAGDDYGARLYIGFPADEHTSWAKRMALKLLAMIYQRPIPAYTLSYVWSRDLALGQRFANPNTDRVQMMVVSQGKATGWQSIERPLVADFVQAFGHVPQTAQGIAVMSDGDDTGAHVEACYGDIELHP